MLGKVSWWLTVIGALNWGLVGAFNFDIVTKVLGSGMPAKVTYIVIGVAAIILLVEAFRPKK